MSISISNNSYDYSMINIKGIELENINGVNNTSEGKAAQKIDQAKKVECQTCKDRKYQDVSNDPGVSFKTPGKIAPQNAGAAVMSHEQEHVRHEAANAATENKQIVSQTVTLQTSTCSECGKSYVSGGQTRTVTKSTNEADKKDYFIANYNDTIAKNFGMLFDVRV